MQKNHRKFFLIERDVNVLHGLEARFRVNGIEVVSDPFIDNVQLILGRIREASVAYIVVGLRSTDLDFLRGLKEDSALSRIPVFAFFELNDKSDLRSAEKAGVEYVFSSKELTLDDIAMKVLKIVKREEDKG